MNNARNILSAEFFDRQGASPVSPLATSSPLSRHSRQMGRVLLQQQCWFFGCDIRRVEGNLLLVHGFTRHRPPAGVEASTQYRLTLADGGLVCLWGFGIFYGDPDVNAGTFLNRFDFDPQLAPRCDFGPDLWQPDGLRGLRRVHSTSDARLARSLVPGVLNWVAQYESWVMEHAGLAYRRECLARWPHASVDPMRTVAEWRKLARVASRAPNAGYFPAVAPPTSVRPSYGG